jgi:putative hydroxymethylpyrimidine transport system permease protein
MATVERAACDSAAGRLIRPARPVASGVPRKALRIVLIGVALVFGWQALVSLFELPPYILPAPRDVWSRLHAQPLFLGRHAAITAIEIAAGLGAGVLAGISTALLMAALPLARRLVLPLVVVSQALPVFAIAPLLVIWFGFGLASKIVMAGLIIYFPIASAFFDGLRRTDPALLDYARLVGAPAWRTLLHIRVPAALPALATGLRVAGTIAPIGAVVGEWVGASAGLGFVMLHANARMQGDLLFAALLLLAALALALRFLVDRLARRLAPWQAET